MAVEPGEVVSRLERAYGAQAGWWPVDRAWHAARGTDPRFEVCVGAILTQNTAWANVERAIENLKARGLLDAKRLARADPHVVREAIRPAGFYNQKAEYVRRFARYVANLDRGLEDLFHGPPKKVRDFLLFFVGIGEETADDMLVYAAGVPSFIVDAYTRRLTKRLRLGSGEEAYAVVQKLWEPALRRSPTAFARAHALIVEHAKRRCTAKLPRCPGCPLEDVCEQVGVDREVYARPRG